MKNEERRTENEERVAVLHSPFFVLHSSFPGRPSICSIIPSAGLNGPERFNSPLADRHAAAVEVHGGTAVGGNYLAPVAYPNTVRTLNGRVLLRQLLYLVIGVSLDDRRAEVARNGLAAGVQDVVSCVPTDD